MRVYGKVSKDRGHSRWCPSRLLIGDECSKGTGIRHIGGSGYKVFLLEIYHVLLL